MAGLNQASNPEFGICNDCQSPTEYEASVQCRTGLNGGRFVLKLPLLSAQEGTNAQVVAFTPEPIARCPYRSQE